MSAIRRPVEKKEKELDEQRSKIIEKGASVNGDSYKESERRSIVIRMPADFLEQIDKAVKKRVGMNRMAWILQAVQAQLERDE